MRLIALPLLVIGAALAGGAYAYQPLTRSDCEQATLVWDENANACTGSVEAPGPPSEPETTQAAGQPLTRIDCERAGMRWNDNAHVCEEARQPRRPRQKSHLPSFSSISTKRAENDGVCGWR